MVEINKKQVNVPTERLKPAFLVANQNDSSAISFQSSLSVVDANQPTGLSKVRRQIRLQLCFHLPLESNRLALCTIELIGQQCDSM